MLLTHALRAISKHVNEQRGLMTHEASVRNASVEPFIRALGYKICDLAEVMPEFAVDQSQPHKAVDYAIRFNGETVIVVEAKSASTTLADTHWRQLYDYFYKAKSRFGILTNGINYKFYAASKKSDDMEKDPFEVLDLYEFVEERVTALERLTKAYIDAEHRAAIMRQWRQNTLTAIPEPDQFEYPIHATPRGQQLEATLVVDSVMNWHKQHILVRFNGELERHKLAHIKAVQSVDPDGGSADSALHFWRYKHPESGADLPINDICEDVKRGGGLKKLLWQSVLLPSADCITVIGCHNDRVFIADLARKYVEQGNVSQRKSICFRGQWLSTKRAAQEAIHSVDPEFAGKVNGVAFWRIIDPDDGKLHLLQYIAANGRKSTDEGLRTRILAYR